MAFKRYAALLAGSALVGSLAFAQPAMADETTEPAQCVRTVEETIEVAQAGTVQLPENFGQIKSVEVEGIPEAKYTLDAPTGTLRFEVPKNTEAGDYSVTITPDTATGLPLTEPLEVTLVDETVDKEEKFDCAIDDITVTEGGDVSRDLTLADGVTELKFTETHGLVVKHEDGKLTVDAGEVKADTYTVEFTYKADGEDKNGTFEVTVEKKKDENASSNFLGSFKGLSSK